MTRHILFILSIETIIVEPILLLNVNLIEKDVLLFVHLTHFSDKLILKLFLSSLVKAKVTYLDLLDILLGILLGTTTNVQLHCKVGA